MTISASLVKELRQRTGAGMMDCKKALKETDGDLDQAVEYMRKVGQAKAEKKAGRTAAEGMIKILCSENGHTAVMVEVNAETDFAARDEHFIQFTNEITQLALSQQVTDVDELNEMTLKDGKTVEQRREELIAQMGENLRVRRIKLQQCPDGGYLGHYVHGGRIGALVALKGGDAALAKDLAMHVTASHPIVIHPEHVPQEKIDSEKEIFRSQAQESGKSEDIIEKMVKGRMQKYLNEVSLLGQPFVKDTNQSVKELLQQKQAQIEYFERFELGEGIEKEASNFAEEVMAQVKGD